DAFRELTAERALVAELTTQLKTPRDQLSARIAELSASLKDAEKRIAKFEADALATKAPGLASSAEQAGAVQLVAQSVGSVASADDLRTLTLNVRDRLGANPGVVALAAALGDRPVVIVATTEAARSAGAKAGALAKVAATILGGGGGGRDDVAQGGGADPAHIPAALRAVREELVG
ncbi:MAG: DHHA1 domain-containing protein, partial [Microbacterium sp.]